MKGRPGALPGEGRVPFCHLLLSPPAPVIAATPPLLPPAWPAFGMGSHSGRSQPPSHLPFLGAAHQGFTFSKTLLDSSRQNPTPIVPTPLAFFWTQHVAISLVISCCTTQDRACLSTTSCAVPLPDTQQAPERAGPPHLPFVPTLRDPRHVYVDITNTTRSHKGPPSSCPASIPASCTAGVSPWARGPGRPESLPHLLLSSGSPYSYFSLCMPTPAAKGLTTPQSLHVDGGAASVPHNPHLLPEGSFPSSSVHTCAEGPAQSSVCTPTTRGASPVPLL